MKKSRRRLCAVVAATCLALGGVGVAAVGAQAASGGYLSTPVATFTSSTSVFLTDEIDVGTGQPADPEPDVGELARIRVHVAAADPRTRLFVGIGPRDAVHDYLAGTAHDEFSGATTAPFRASFHPWPGAAVAPDPTTQPIWVARSTGSGDVTLEWDKSAGPWSLVVLDPDGGSGLEVRADLGFRFGFLVPVGAGLLGTGAVLVVVVVIGRRRSAPAGQPPKRVGFRRRDG